MRRTARPRRLLPVAALLGGSLVLGGCSATGSTEPGAQEQRASASPTPAPQETSTRPTLALTSDGPAEVCEVARYGPTYNLFDVAARATGDVEVTGVDLVGRGVRLTGPVLTVPPVDVGGEIPYADSSAGALGESISDTRFLEWESRDVLDTHVYGRGDTALLLAHVEVTPTQDAPAVVESLALSYTDAAGESRTARIELNQMFSAGACGSGGTAALPQTPSPGP